MSYYGTDVGFWATLTGRAKPQPAILDPLFALSSAAGTVATGVAFTPTGLGSVCFRALEERAFRDIEYDVRDWLNRDAETMPVDITEDFYGFTWMVIRRPPDRFESLIADMHTAGLKFTNGGFGPQLLCAVAKFQDRGGRCLGIVYNYKRGTFYPFAPRSGETRDNDLELRIKDVINGRLPLEPELKRWFPVWGAPGL